MATTLERSHGSRDRATKCAAHCLTHLPDLTRPPFHVVEGAGRQGAFASDAALRAPQSPT